MEQTLALDEAARRLGISTRTLREYVKSGYLSIVKQGNHKRLDPLEVEEFRKARQETGKGIVARKEVLELRARLRRLETDMAAVLRVLDTRDAPLRMGAGYAQELHAACAQQLALGTWKPVEIEPWIEIFLRVDEDDFQAISEATSDRKPWKAFMSLCVAMSAAVVGYPDYTTSLELQGIHRRLAEGRRRMRVAALCHAEMHGSLDTDVRRLVLSDMPVSVSDTLSAVLQRKRRTQA